MLLIVIFLLPGSLRLEPHMLVIDLDPESPPWSLRIVDRPSGCVVMEWHGASCRRVLDAAGLTPAELRAAPPGPPQRPAIHRLLVEALVADFTGSLAANPTIRADPSVPRRS